MKVAERISDYFTYVEDANGVKYMIALPYDYTFSVTSSSHNGIKIECDNEYTDHAANTAAYEIKNYISENRQGEYAPIKCIVYDSSLCYVYTENGREEQIDNAIAIREFIGICNNE